MHIDHFVESNIIGFYYLARQFGGMEVCIKKATAQGGFAPGANLTDVGHAGDSPSDNSGFNAYEDGYNRKKGGEAVPAPVADAVPRRLTSGRATPFPGSTSAVRPGSRRPSTT